MPAPNPTLELIRRENLRQGPYGFFTDKYQVTDFMEATVVAATPNWAISGTNASELDETMNAGGGVDLVTAGADNDQFIIAAKAASALKETDWSPQYETRFHALIELPETTLVSCQVKLALTAAYDLTTDDDYAGFQFSVEGATSTTNWTAIESVVGVDTETDLGTAPLAGKSIDLQIRISKSGFARYFVNGIKKHTSTTPLTTTALLIPVIGVQALEIAAKTLTVRGVRMSRNLPASS